MRPDEFRFLECLCAAKMPSWCALPKCKKQQRKDSQTTFHLFPHKRPDNLRKWLQSIGDESFVPKLREKICSDHFDPSCFYASHCRKTLKPDAVPTIFQWKDPPLKNESVQEPEVQDVCSCEDSQFMTQAEAAEGYNDAPPMLNVFAGSIPSEPSTSFHGSEFEQRVVQCLTPQVAPPSLPCTPPPGGGKDHTYTGHVTARTELHTVKEQLRKVKRKLSATEKKLRRREKKIEALENLISEMKEKNLLSENAEQHLLSFGEILGI